MWRDFKYAIEWYLVRVFLFNVVIGGTGVFLIVYGTGVHIWPNWRIPQLESAASFLSALVTFVGVSVTAVSVYFEPRKPSRPATESKYLVAPVVIAGCVAGLYALFVIGIVPDHVVNGFALLGLAGVLFRLQRNPQRAAEET